MAFDKIVVVPKVGGTNIKAAKQFATQLRNDERFLKKGILVTGDDSKADEDTLVVAIGGDGTVLHAAKLAAQNGSTILGVNLGNVGFLADLQAESAIEQLLTINDNGMEDPIWLCDERLMLSLSNGATETDHIAFNDFAISDAVNGKMIGYDLCIDGQHAGYHRANGVIISTPTGSTGYSLSAGGPIILPSTKAFAITPVAPISLSSRPIIVGSNSSIVLTIEHPRALVWYPKHPRASNNSTLVSCSLVIKADGMSLTDYMMNESFLHSYTDDIVTYKITVRKAKQTVKMIHPIGYNYFSILKEKLGWNS